MSPQGQVRNGKGPIPQDLLLIFCEVRSRILKRYTASVRRGRVGKIFFAKKIIPDQVSPPAL